MVALAGFALWSALEISESNFSISGDCGKGAEVGFAVGVVAEGVGTGLEVGDDSGTLVTAGVGFIATPLFHTNFVPDLTQVNFFPPEIEVAPAFTHFVPALTAATAEVPASKSDQMIKGATIRRPLRMSKFKPSDDVGDLELFLID
jgi:hypothetical protein